MLQKCCFFVPLDFGCMTIAITMTCFHLIEMIGHGKDTVFMHDHEEMRQGWVLYLQSAILSSGIIASLLLFYGARKRRRSLVILWLVVFVITFVIYTIMTIKEAVSYEPSVWISVLQISLLLILAYCLIIVFSFCRELTLTEEDEDPL